MSKQVQIVMPVFNEAEGIVSFLTEIAAAFEGSAFQVGFSVVDDCSTDSTVATVKALRIPGVDVELFEQRQNSGHGPSTVQAMKLGIASNADFVVTVDGDGQFLGADIRRLVERLDGSKDNLVEGVRTKRTDPLYRQVVSLATQFLVFSVVGQFPPDANTPLRAYRPEILVKILTLLLSDARIPNLYVSAITRKSGMPFGTLKVQSLERRGTNSVGTMWGSGLKKLPSKRFIDFCKVAIVEWNSMAKRIGSSNNL